MNKYIFIFLSFLFLSNAYAEVKKTSKPKIVASFSILGDFVHQIAGDLVEIDTLVGPNGDAHVYEPTPADAKKIMRADIIFMNGLGFEGWLPRLLNATQTTAKLVNVTDKIRPRHIKEGSCGSIDPHAWHDIENAVLYGEAILRALKVVAPSHAEVFSANWKALKGRLKKLDHDFRKKIQSVKPSCRKVITLHDGFQYLGKAYGIEFLTPLGISTEVEPSAKDLVGIIKEAKAHNIKVVFLENISNPRIMEQIAKESGAKIGDVLFSDALSEIDEEAPTFESMMLHNFSVFMKAFKSACNKGEIIILQES